MLPEASLLPASSLLRPVLLPVGLSIPFPWPHRAPLLTGAFPSSHQVQSITVVTLPEVRAVTVTKEFADPLQGPGHSTNLVAWLAFKHFEDETSDHLG